MMGAEEQPMLRLEKLEVGYRAALLPPITLSVRPGQQWAVLGQNGAGKTTFLRTLLGLQPALAGTVTFPEGRRPGYVPQRSSLSRGVPGRVVDVVRGGVDHGWSFLRPLYARQRRDAVEVALRDVGVDDLRAQPFLQLSEGQKQKVLIARALAADPHLLVLDEPTAAMDRDAERSIFDLIDKLRGSRDLAVVMVSHQLGLAAKHATHGLLVDKDQHLVVCGDMDFVAGHEAIQERYGLWLERARSEAYDD